MLSLLCSGGCVHLVVCGISGIAYTYMYYSSISWGELFLNWTVDANERQLETFEGCETDIVKM